MAIITVICGEVTWDNIGDYRQAKEDWPSGFLNLKNRITPQTHLADS
jgi:hypothetical protein